LRTPELAFDLDPSRDYFTSVVLAMIGLVPTSLASDYTEWVAKGYRWSLVNGPSIALKSNSNARQELIVSAWVRNPLPDLSRVANVWTLFEINPDRESIQADCWKPDIGAPAYLPLTIGAHGFLC
jgi:hypothetical protein